MVRSKYILSTFCHLKVKKIITFWIKIMINCSHVDSRFKGILTENYLKWCSLEFTFIQFALNPCFPERTNLPLYRTTLTRRINQSHIAPGEEVASLKRNLQDEQNPSGKTTGMKLYSVSMKFVHRDG